MTIETFMENVRSLRKSLGMSQEDLADKLGISAQAVSKWECGMSYPDIEMLVTLADVFGVTVDSLLRGTASRIDTMPDVGAGLPDDDKLRVVQFIGQKMLSVNNIDPENIIPLYIDNEMLGDAALNVEIWGSAEIKGDVNGNVTTNAPSIVENNISLRNVSANISCGDVGGDVHTGAGHIDCGDVNGSIRTNAGQIKCGDVGGDVNAGAGTINCGDISGSAHTNVGAIHCRSHG